jgi:hypothetical protein
MTRSNSPPEGMFRGDVKMFGQQIVVEINEKQKKIKKKKKKVVISNRNTEKNQEALFQMKNKISKI